MLLLSSHALARALLAEPDLPMAYRGPEWAVHLPAEVTRVQRIAVATRSSLVEPLELILIEADPDHQLKEIPRGQPSTTNQDSGTGSG